MKTTFLKLPAIPVEQRAANKWIQSIGPEFLLIILLMIWFIAPEWLRRTDPTAGEIVNGTSMVILLGFITFLLILGLSWWLLDRFWTMQGMPARQYMVLQFKTLELWQQLGFYWLSFALLLLAAISCIGSIA